MKLAALKKAQKNLNKHHPRFLLCIFLICGQLSWANDQEFANYNLQLAMLDTGNATQIKQKTSDDRAREIMESVYQQTRKYDAQELDMTMIISNKANKKRERHFTLSILHSGDQTKSLIDFYKPASVKGSRLLTHMENTTDTKQWMFIPAFKSIKQISANEKDSSFMGSDFSYSDIAGRQLDQDQHKLVKQDERFYYISSTPRNPNDLYTKMNIIVDRERHVIAKIDFYKNGKPVKKLVNKSISKYGDMYISTKSIMYNLASKGKSEIKVHDVNVDADILDDNLEIKSLY